MHPSVMLVSRNEAMTQITAHLPVQELLHLWVVFGQQYIARGPEAKHVKTGT